MGDPDRTAFEEHLALLRPTRYMALWIATLLLAIAWPLVYSIFVHSILCQNLDHGRVSTDELKNLLGAGRYTTVIPMEFDGHFLRSDC